jgi:hypothetical protein
MRDVLRGRVDDFINNLNEKQEAQRLKLRSVSSGEIITVSKLLKGLVPVAGFESAPSLRGTNFKSVAVSTSESM